ncbi:hypothetical protein KY49_680 [Burkholderia sp. MSHR3999]|uniref:hypothetical protein n=1 Tax=Burkholderia sp. MSHR3999 TaxID=1542965 RepID=UPI0005AC8239|nr:hypothetical protein [Burkholderia sp. MSHR3999]KIP13439.1 hypothetical protein KY49_680 [Burkholderia sp. MSHR3999]
MKERPILFSGPMVRAILDGRKTQTRRVVNPQPVYGDIAGTFASWMFKKRHASGRWLYPNARDFVLAECPHGQPGDRLWVRETWQHCNHPLGPYDADCLVFYRADYLDDPHGPDGEKSPEGKYRDWRPSIHMPRAASRITLEITDVRVERLQDISEVDAIDEGVLTLDEGWARQQFPDYFATRDATLPGEKPPRGPSPRVRFSKLWNSLNASRGHGWDTNPWVWAVQFRGIHGPEKR